MKIKNPLKRTDVFSCTHGAHQGFNGKVSAYHVLREKHCYPSGCIYFLWRCVRLEKGNRCVHGYTTPGRKCKGCTYYVEEKLHFQPILLLSPEVYSQFVEDVENYENWLEKIRFTQQAIAGKIDTVKPWFEKHVFPDRTRIDLRGYLLVFKRGFIGMDMFEDPFYVRISHGQMQEYGFLPKMKVEMVGEIREDRGRIVVQHIRQVEKKTKGWGWHWTRDKALVAVKTATEFEHQPEKCIACPSGALVDVTELTETEERKYRRLYCLKGIVEPSVCCVSAFNALKKAKSFTESIPTSQTHLH